MVPRLEESGMNPTPTRTSRAAGPTDGRAGFTLVELLVTLAVVGILAGLAIPNLRTAILRSRAAQVYGDTEVVKVAAVNYHADNNTWPAESPLGSVPSGLVPYLPDEFTFGRDGYQLDFENWTLPGGLPGDPSTRTLVGVSVNTDDEALGNAFVEFMGGRVVFSVGNSHTIVIDRS